MTARPLGSPFHTAVNIRVRVNEYLSRAEELKAIVAASGPAPMAGLRKPSTMPAGNAKRRVLPGTKKHGFFFSFFRSVFPFSFSFPASASEQRSAGSNGMPTLPNSALRSPFSYPCACCSPSPNSQGVWRQASPAAAPHAALHPPSGSHGEIQHEGAPITPSFFTRVDWQASHVAHLRHSSSELPVSEIEQPSLAPIRRWGDPTPVSSDEQDSVHTHTPPPSFAQTAHPAWKGLKSRSEEEAVSTATTLESGDAEGRAEEAEMSPREDLGGTMPVSLSHAQSRGVWVGGGVGDDSGHTAKRFHWCMLELQDILRPLVNDLMTAFKGAGWPSQMVQLEHRTRSLWIFGQNTSACVTLPRNCCKPFAPIPIYVIISLFTVNPKQLQTHPTSLVQVHKTATTADLGAAELLEVMESQWGRFDKHLSSTDLLHVKELRVWIAMMPRLRSAKDAFRGIDTAERCLCPFIAAAAKVLPLSVFC